MINGSTDFQWFPKCVNTKYEKLWLIMSICTHLWKIKKTVEFHKCCVKAKHFRLHITLQIFRRVHLYILHYFSDSQSSLFIFNLWWLKRLDARWQILVPGRPAPSRLQLYLALTIRASVERLLTFDSYDMPNLHILGVTTRII